MKPIPITCHIVHTNTFTTILLLRKEKNHEITSPHKEGN